MHSGRYSLARSRPERHHTHTQFLTTHYISRNIYILKISQNVNIHIIRVSKQYEYMPDTFVGIFEASLATVLMLDVVR
jgi:hypothetical protein